MAVTPFCLGLLGGGTMWLGILETLIPNICPTLDGEKWYFNYLFCFG